MSQNDNNKEGCVGPMIIRVSILPHAKFGSNDHSEDASHFTLCFSQCGYDFCWMCNGPWKDHGAQYYECSKYKEDETVGDVQAKVAIACDRPSDWSFNLGLRRTTLFLVARRCFSMATVLRSPASINLKKTDSRVSLSKYLHYFQRWENHCRSLKLEKKFMEKLGLIL